jgi:hypothetical protein
MSATHLRKMFMPLDGLEEMTGLEPVEPPEIIIDTLRFQR